MCEIIIIIILSTHRVCGIKHSLRTAFLVVRTVFLVLRTLYAPYLCSTHSRLSGSTHSLPTVLVVVHTLYAPYLWYYALSTHRLFGSTHSLRTVFWYYALSTHRIIIIHTSEGAVQKKQKKRTDTNTTRHENAS